MSVSVLMSFAKNFCFSFHNFFDRLLHVAQCIQDGLGQVMELGLPRNIGGPAGKGVLVEGRSEEKKTSPLTQKKMEPKR